MRGKTKRCPQCKSEVPAEEPHCPNCPYSWPEEQDEAPGTSRSLTPSWSPVPLVLLLAAAALGGVGWLIVVRKGDVVAPAQQKDGPSPLFAPNKTAPQKAPEEAPAPAPAPPARDAEAEARFVREQVGLVDEPQVREWRLRGAVYDLVTLAPIAHCLVEVSQASTGQRFETTTDASGRYRLLVPALERDAYQVKLQARGYSRSYLNPEVENVRAMPEPKRRETAAELASSFLAPYELTGSAQPLVTDFYLAPER